MRRDFIALLGGAAARGRGRSQDARNLSAFKSNAKKQVESPAGQLREEKDLRADADKEIDRTLREHRQGVEKRLRTMSDQLSQLERDLADRLTQEAQALLEEIKLKREDLQHAIEKMFAKLSKVTTDASLPAGHFMPGDFRVGQVLRRTLWVFSRNFLTFMVVTTLADLPSLFLPNPLQNPGVWVVVSLLSDVLDTLGQAVLLFAVLQVLRGRPIDLVESARIGLRRFLTLVGLTITVHVLVDLALLFLVLPGLTLITIWFVAIPVCLLEQLGPVDSLERSRELTKGYRWKIFGMLLPLFFIPVIMGVMVQGVWIWSVILGVFANILTVVTYHDLRAAKEGIDTNQIVAVFE